MRKNRRSSCTTRADIAAWRNVAQGLAPTRHVKANSFESNQVMARGSLIKESQGQG